MDIKQLMYFIAIVEEGSITAAAKRLHIAQPPLSQQLKLLENELDICLINRTSRHLELTDAGKVFFERAKKIVDMNTSAKKEMQELSKGDIGTIILGCTSTTAPAILNECLLDFKAKHPNIHFHIQEGDTFAIIELVQKGIIDIGIVRTPFNSGNLNCIYKKSEPMLAVMKEEINWNDTENCNLQELSRQTIITYSYDRILNELYTKYDINPSNLFLKCDRAYTALLCAELGMGVAIVPKSAYSIKRAGMLCKTITEDGLVTSVAAIWSKQRHLVKSAELFLDFFENGL